MALYDTLRGMYPEDPEMSLDEMADQPEMNSAADFGLSMSFEDAAGQGPAPAPAPGRFQLTDPTNLAPSVQAAIREAVEQGAAPGAGGASPSPGTPAPPSGGSAPPGAPPAPFRPAPGLRSMQQTVQGVEGGPTTEQRQEYARGMGQSAMTRLQEEKRILDEEMQARAKRRGELQAEIEAEEQKRNQQLTELENQRTFFRTKQEELINREQEPIDPQKYFQNMGTLQTMMGLVSAGIFGYMNPRAQGQAPVTKQLMDNARMDVQAQLANRDQLNRQQQQLINMYEAKLGDQDLVRKQLESDRLMTVRKQLKLEDMQDQTPEYRAAAGRLVADLEKTQRDIDQEVAKAAWERERTVSTTYGRPKPVGGGRTTASQVWKEIQARRNIEETTETGRTPQENKEIRDRRAKLNKETRAEVATLSQKLSPTMDFVNGMDVLFKELGVTVSDAGELQFPEDIPGVGPLDSWGLMPDEKRAAIRAAKQNMKDTMVRMRTGAAMSEDEEVFYTEMLDAATETEFKPKMRAIHDFMRRRIRDIQSQASDTALSEWARRRTRPTTGASPAGTKPVKTPIAGLPSQQITPHTEPDLFMSMEDAQSRTFDF